MKKFLITSCLCLSFAACNAEIESQTAVGNGSAEQTNPNGWVTLNADLLDGGDFTLLTPSGWTFEQGVGIDSQVGTISGDGIVLTFDYGLYSGNPITSTGSGEKLKAQDEIIDGLNAVILTPKVTGDGEVALYFDTLALNPSQPDSTEGSQLLDDQRFLLEGENLTADQEATVLQIFRTIRFKR